MTRALLALLCLVGSNSWAGVQNSGAPNTAQVKATTVGGDINGTIGNALLNATQSNVSTFTIKQNGAIPLIYPNAPISAVGNINGYLQFVLQNLSNGANASGDFILTNDLGSNTSFYLDVGINSSKYSQSSYTGESSSDAFVSSSDSSLDLEADINGSSNGGSGDIKFMTGGANYSNIRMFIQNDGAITIPSGSTVTLPSVIATAVPGVQENLSGGTTVVYMSGGIGYYPYTMSLTTTTSANTIETFFSTMTVPANSISRRGQKLIITCRYMMSANADSKTTRIRFNNSGTYTDVGTNIAHSINGQLLTHTANLSWISSSLWINSGFDSFGSSSDSKVGAVNVPQGTQAFNETTALTFNCTCTNSSSIQGDCSFLDMSMELGGM